MQNHVDIAMKCQELNEYTEFNQALWPWLIPSNGTVGVSLLFYLKNNKMVRS